MSIVVTDGKPISSIQTTATTEGSDLFILARSLSNRAISYTNLLSEISTDLGFSLPLTTAGDILTRDGSSNIRLGIGTNGQVLTVNSGATSWEDLPAGYSDPLTTDGDVLIRDNGVTKRLSVGTDGQVLTVDSGVPAWVDNTGTYTDPLTTDGDIVIRDGGISTRLPAGADDQFLRMNSGVPNWETVSILSDPTSQDGDLIIRSSSALNRLAVGTEDQILTVSSGGLPQWSTLSQYSDPLTTDGDMLIRTGGNNVRLAVGTDDQYLSVQSGSPTWVDVNWFLDPMTTVGDIAYRNGSNETERFPIGSNNEVLRVSSGNLDWFALADVAYDNDYNSLDNLPTIPSVINDLSNVNASPSPNDFLQWNGSLWVAGSGAVGALDDLSDVSAGSPTNGDILQYNSGSGDWESTAFAPGTGDLLGTGTTGYHAMWAVASKTLEDSSVFEDVSFVYTSLDLAVDSASNAATVSLGNVGNDVNYPNAHVYGFGRTIEVGHNIFNGYAGESGSKFRASGNSLSLMATDDASGSFSTIGYFNTSEIGLNKNTTITGSLSTTGAASIQGSLIDTDSDSIRFHAEDGVTTVAPGSDIISSNSGEWKLGKDYNNGAGNLIVDDTNYIEVEVEGTTYKLALAVDDPEGTPGGDPPTPPTSYSVSFAMNRISGDATGQLYYAITADATPPLSGEYIQAYSSTSTGVITPSSPSVSVEDGNYLWVHINNTMPDFANISDNAPWSVSGNDGSNFSNSKYHIIDSAGTITVTVEAGA